MLSRTPTIIIPPVKHTDFNGMFTILDFVNQSTVVTCVISHENFPVNLSQLTTFRSKEELIDDNQTITSYNIEFTATNKDIIWKFKLRKTRDDTLKAIYDRFTTPLLTNCSES